MLTGSSHHSSAPHDEPPQDPLPPEVELAPVDAVADPAPVDPAVLAVPDPAVEPSLPPAVAVAGPEPAVAVPTEVDSVALAPVDAGPLSVPSDVLELPVPPSSPHAKVRAAMAARSPKGEITERWESYVVRKPSMLRGYQSRRPAPPRAPDTPDGHDDRCHARRCLRRPNTRAGARPPSGPMERGRPPHGCRPPCSMGSPCGASRRWCPRWYRRYPRCPRFRCPSRPCPARRPC